MSNTTLNPHSQVVPDTDSLKAAPPLYQQLADRIRQAIYKGEVEVGQRIATEAELMARHGVSHITVRRAMQELSNEGLLIRTRGKGTFVNPSVFTGVYNYLFVHGLELDGLAYPYTARLLNGMSRQNRDRVRFRLEMLALPPQSFQEGHEDRRVEDLLSHTKIHGIIALPRLRFETLTRLAKHDVFIVQIGMSEPTPPGVVFIDVPAQAVCRLKAGHLRLTGRRRIGFIAQPDPDYNRYHIPILQAALNQEELMLEDIAIEPGRWGINGGQAAAALLLRRCPDLDVILTSDDLQALGAMMAVRQTGRRIPEDVAIIGQGNTLAEHSHCGLTTVDARTDERGALAVQALERLLKGEKVDPILRLEPKLIVRQSG